MRHGRAKAARKNLAYFSRTIGLRAPYHILLDGTLVVAMFNQKIVPFKERMDRVLQTKTPNTNKYCIAKETLHELQMVFQNLEAKKHSKAASFQQALEFIQNECIILKSDNDDDDVDVDETDSKAKNPYQELMQHITKDEDKPYIVASQDEVLLNELRLMGTVPIVRLANNSVLILENPSKQSQRQFQGKERKKWRHSLEESEQELVNLVKSQKRAAVKEQSNSFNSTALSRQRTKTKAKGPNPLSCKRKQGSDEKSANKKSATKKRRLRAKQQKAQEA